MQTQPDRAASLKQLFVLQEIDAQLDQLREQQQLASLLMDPRHAHLESERVRARQRSHEIVAALGQREEERVELVRQFPAELVSTYEGVRRRWLTRPWVLAHSGPSCGACSLVLPLALRDKLACGERPGLCPRCGRLLVCCAPAAPAR